MSLGVPETPTDLRQKKRCGDVAISFLLKKPRGLVLFVKHMDV